MGAFATHDGVLVASRVTTDADGSPWLFQSYAIYHFFTAECGMTANESHRGFGWARRTPLQRLLQTFGRNRTAGDKGADARAARARPTKRKPKTHDARGAPGCVHTAPGCVTVRPRGASQSGPGARHRSGPGARHSQADGMAARYASAS